MPDAVKAYEAGIPRLVSTIPAHGDENVDPARGQIVLTFDRRMGPGVAITATDKTLMPRMSELAWNDEHTVLTVKVALEPGHTYEFGLNFGGGGGSLRSAEGVPLRYTRIRFQTRAE